jgi:hypothetical protein
MTPVECGDLCCSLPAELEVLSDSAVEMDPERSKKTRLDVPLGESVYVMTFACITLRPAGYTVLTVYSALWNLHVLFVSL